MGPCAIPSIKIQSQVCSWYTAHTAVVARSRLGIVAPLDNREGSFTPCHARHGTLNLSGVQFSVFFGSKYTFWTQGPCKCRHHLKSKDLHCYTGYRKG